MTERYALYFAPAESSLLWQRASLWLGRDPASGEVLPQPAIPGLTTDRFSDLTEAARRYGFHATLKPPFRLAESCDRAKLELHLQSFAETTLPVSLGPVEIRPLMGFLAVMPHVQAPVVTAFAANCVAGFETCRAPLSAVEHNGRLASGLTTRQVELLDQYGYPYVMDEFRFHMTLTDRIDPADRDLIMPAAEAFFAEALAEPITIDRIVLFHEPEPDAPFFRLADFPLTGSA